MSDHVFYCVILPQINNKPFRSDWKKEREDRESYNPFISLEQTFNVCFREWENLISFNVLICTLLLL